MSLALKIDTGDHESRKAAGPLEAGRAKEIDSPLEPPERSTALPTCDF